MQKATECNWKPEKDNSSIAEDLEEGFKDTWNSE